MEAVLPQIATIFEQLAEAIDAAWLMQQNVKLLEAKLDKANATILRYAMKPRKRACA